MKKNHTRLKLSRTILRTLASAELGRAAGGISGGPSVDCSGSCSGVPGDVCYTNQCPTNLLSCRDNCL